MRLMIKLTNNPNKIKTLNAHIALLMVLALLFSVFAPFISSFANSDNIVLKNEKDYLNLVKKL